MGYTGTQAHSHRRTATQVQRRTSKKACAPFAGCVQQNTWAAQMARMPDPVPTSRTTLSLKHCLFPRILHAARHTALRTEGGKANRIACGGGKVNKSKKRKAGARAKNCRTNTHHNRHQGHALSGRAATPRTSSGARGSRGSSTCDVRCLVLTRCSSFASGVGPRAFPLIVRRKN